MVPLAGAESGALIAAMPPLPELWDQGSWDKGTWDAEAETNNPSNPMPVQNISAQFTTQALADTKTAIAALTPLFPILVTLTETERKSLQRVGAGRETFCETAITGAQNFTTVVPTFIPLAEWLKDNLYFDQLEELEVPLAALLAKV